MNILGLGGWNHDASAAIICNGKVDYILEEERFTRVRYQGKSHQLSIEKALRLNHLKMSDIDRITFGFSRDSFTDIQNKYKSEIHLSKSQELIGVDHHASHAASAFFLSQFDEATIITIDGYGDGYSASIWEGKDNNLKPLLKTPTPTSLGGLWMGVTQYLGFGMRSAGKTMALSALGTPIYLDFLVDQFLFDSENIFQFDLRKYNKTAYIDSRKSFFKSLLGPPLQPGDRLEQRHYDLASSLQHFTNLIGEKFVVAAKQLSTSRNLCISGGVALNGVMNTHIAKMPEFDKVYVPPYPSDTGSGIGGALYYYNHMQEMPRIRSQCISPYKGVSFPQVNIERALENYNCKRLNKNKNIKEYLIPFGGEYQNLYYIRSDEFTLITARLLSEGYLVAWFQDKSECGPRALGNRSLLADPRRKDMKSRINSVKRREWFRPFAPAILESEVTKFFEHYIESPYMSFVLPIKESKRNLIPAVSHLDGTARLQTVSIENNQKFFQLISEFNKLTSIPILLNTSFNVNEPIVDSPMDALNCFVHNSIDILVIHDFIVIKG